MKWNNKFMTGLLFLLLICAACTDEPEVIPGGEPDVQGKTVSLTISSRPLLGSGAVTRSTGKGMDVSLGGELDVATRAGMDDEKISNICVFQFEGTKEASTAVLKAKTYLKDLVDKTVEINLQPSTQSFFYVCANVGDITGTYTVGTSTFRNLMDASLALVNGQGDVSSLLPMSGSSDVFNANSLSGNVAVTLVRMVAKVSFVCDLSKLPTGASFNITNAKLCNVPTTLKYYPSAGSSSGTSVTTYVGVGTVNATAKTTTYIWYMPENKRGTGRNTVTDWTERIEKNAPLYATYIELVGNYTAKAGGETIEVTYVIYLGNATDKNNYDVERNHRYLVTSAIKGINLTDQRVTIDTNLSADGLANCYLASKDNHWYRFNGTVMGNGNATDYAAAKYPGLKMLPDGGVHITGITKAFVVWETAEGLINKVEWDSASGCVKFKTGEKKGNALIAVSNGTDILWSWHIWRTDGVDLAELNRSHVLDIETNTNRSWYTEGTVNAGAAAGRQRPLRLMDRNLGAAFAGEIDSEDFKGAYSLHYQFGRKDPFPGGNTYNTNIGKVEGDVTLYGYRNNKATFTIANNKAAAPGVNAGTMILTTIKNPEVFYTCSDVPYNWISTATLNTDDWKISNCLWGDENVMSGALNSGYMDNDPWDGEKTIYDPSPYGWRVAPADTWTGTANTTIKSWIKISIDNIYKTSNWSSATPWGHTVYFNNNAAGTKTFLPASGIRHYGEGMLYHVGTYGFSWLSSPGGQGDMYGSSLAFSSGSLYVANGNCRVYGFSVRCVQE